MKIFLAIFLLVIVLFPSFYCSSGDQSNLFNNCLANVYSKICSGENLQRFNLEQSFYMKVLQWSCLEESKYICTQEVTNYCKKNKINIPQFFGKWPFKRIYGIQDPASFAFSLLNLFANIHMLYKFIVKTSHNAPFYAIWVLYGILSIFTWFSSALFHLRDTSMTELCDYFSAFLLNCYFLFAFLLRAFGRYPIGKSMSFLVGLTSLFIYHYHYMTRIKFDYGYNMKINVFLGLFETFGWLFWSVKNYNGSNRRYVWKCILSVVLAKAILPLELGDFPPWFDLVDSHALWHLCSVPLPFIWFSFLIDDCNALYAEEKQLHINEIASAPRFNEKND